MGTPSRTLLKQGARLTSRTRDVEFWVYLYTPCSFGQVYTDNISVQPLGVTSNVTHAKESEHTRTHALFGLRISSVLVFNMPIDVSNI